MTKKKGFTLVELIAVIVVLTIILAITVPGITGIVKNSTMKAVESDAKLVLDSIRLKKIEDNTFDPITLTKTNVSNLLGLSDENYSNLEVKINEGQTYIKITGQGKWSGFSACGTYFNMQVNEGDCYLDFNDPVITLLGDSFVSINVGQAYTDAGATANDVEDGDITGRIVKTGTVNPSVPGTYTITYNVSDTAGREAVSVTRTVYVIDVEAPVITILGDNPVNINVGGTYSDAGATALDDADGDVTSRIVTTGTVNPSIAGTYTITYTVSDNAGHESTAVRTVNVIDNILPTVSFSMNGNATWAKTRSTTVTVSDAHTGVNTSSLKYQWNTSTTAPTEASFTTTFTNGGTISSPVGVTGTYYLWILAKDNSNNTLILKTNIFNLDNILPVITMMGNSIVNITVGSTYNDAGASATDAHSGVGSVSSTGSVNINTVGTYYINYNVTDNAGNAATQLTRTVNVTAVELFAIDSAGGTFGYIFKYVYNGSSWSGSQIVSPKAFVTINPIDANNFYAIDSAGTTYGYIFKYTYNGSSWNGSQIVSPKAFISMSSIDTNNFYAIDSAGGTFGYIFKYTYNGSSWNGTQIGSPKAFVSISKIDANNFYAIDSAGTTYGYIFKYTYNGSSWNGTQIVSPKAFVAISAIDANSFYAIDSAGGTYGYIFKYTFDGSSWNGTQIGSPKAFVAISAIDANNFYAIDSAGGTYGYLFKYTYNGSSWNATQIGSPKAFVDVGKY